MIIHSLVSVVIPCYNHGDYLVEAVNSVLDSTYPHVEIIIVDDGSTDNTGEIARQVMTGHENIFYIYQSNQGPSVARNRGIEEANGSYILTLDADDKISSHYIEEALEVLKTSSETMLVYCKAEYFGLKNGLWDLKPFSLKKLAIDNMIFSCAMFRKIDWRNAGVYAQELKTGWEDWEFWISMLKNGGHVCRLELTGFYYRIHQFSRRRTNKKTEIERHAIDFVNQKHHGFITTHLKGPLRMNRKKSLLINTFYNTFGIAKFERINFVKGMIQLMDI